MSRSRKKAIIKDKPRNAKASTLYWRQVRSSINQKVRQIQKNASKLIEEDSIDVEEEEQNPDWLVEPLDESSIPDPRQIVNDYDYSDYSIDYEHNNVSRWWKKYGILKDPKTKYRRK